MGRSFRVRVDVLAKKTPAPAPVQNQAPAPAQEPATEIRTDKTTADAVDSQKAPVAASARVPEVYGDVCVCQALGIRRRHIASARTKASRGTDWDVVGLHAGMTMAWIQRTALELHVVPNFKLLKPIQEGDHVVSCSLAAVVPNNRRAIVDVVATGERKIVWVKDSSMMRLREIFDCYDDHGTLSADRELNEVSY